MVRADDLQEKAEDPAGLQRPADRDLQADPGDLAESLAELPEARLVRRPEPVSEILAGAEPVPRARGVPAITTPGGIAYPEWDWRKETYASRAVVRERPGILGNAAWVENELRRMPPPCVRYVATSSACARDGRRSGARGTGLDLDLDALVEAYADRRAGSVGDDRFHVDTRPVRPRRGDRAAGGCECLDRRVGWEGPGASSTWRRRRSLSSPRHWRAG
jgi:nitric oxide reductase NorD protein